ncbi:MAG: phosphoribosylanthranilate isomerase [Wenzhouxiangellaceae bacterium]|nr:phosphoribosylanthranilate isomerase [Wenzhouxiangellaceae bacterium]
MPIRVKICGVTRPCDAQSAAALGASAIGLVFVERSPRAVDIEQALSICRALPPLVGVVGLFMDPEADFVRTIGDRVPLNWLQFHGDEPATFCRSFNRPYIKALPMASPEKVDYDSWPDAGALLLDAHSAGAMGGSGSTFDWTGVKPPRQPWILAGGLNPDNISTAIEALEPSAIDVSSGVESAPGIKDDNLMTRLMKGIPHG